MYASHQSMFRQITCWVRYCHVLHTSQENSSVACLYVWTGNIQPAIRTAWRNHDEFSYLLRMQWSTSFDNHLYLVLWTHSRMREFFQSYIIRSNLCSYLCLSVCLCYWWNINCCTLFCFAQRSFTLVSAVVLGSLPINMDDFATRRDI